jgi:hypothetical protein
MVAAVRSSPGWWPQPSPTSAVPCSAAIDFASFRRQRRLPCRALLQPPSSPLAMPLPRFTHWPWPHIPPAPALVANASVDSCVTFSWGSTHPSPPLVPPPRGALPPSVSLRWLRSPSGAARRLEAGVARRLGNSVRAWDLAGR